MRLMRYNPTREMERLEDRIARMFSDFAPAWSRREEGLDTWEPAVDIWETEKAYLIKAELPEVDKKDVHVNVEGNILTLTGERRREEEVKEEHVHRTERFFGHFTRSFVLPDTVDTGGIKATYKDGVMKLELPKREEVKPKEIAIEAA